MNTDTDSDTECNQRVTATSKRFIEMEPAVRRGFMSLPESIRDQFLVSLLAVANDCSPLLKFTHLSLTKGLSAVELKINGSPAYRCVYTTKIEGKIHVVYAGKKTSEGTDRLLIETVTKRLKAIK